MDVTSAPGKHTFRWNDASRAGKELRDDLVKVPHDTGVDMGSRDVRLSALVSQPVNNIVGMDPLFPSPSPRPVMDS